MTRRPEDAPLGAPPALPEPEPNASSNERAAALFERLRKRHTELLQAAARMEQQPEPQQKPQGFGGGRRYDLAMALVGASLQPPGAEESRELSDETQVMRSPAGEENYDDETHAGVEPSEPLARPPVGAPMVRPSAKRRAVETVPQDMLEGAADNVLLFAGADGETTFEISIKDEIFEDLACRISVKDGRVLAVFLVRDPNMRRLIEAESGRLRARLEERGLKVTEVRVQEE